MLSSLAVVEYKEGLYIFVIVWGLNLNEAKKRILCLGQRS